MHNKANIIIYNAEFSYDAWGRMRNPDDWTDYTVNASNMSYFLLACRGFTGHEHMQDYALINMNGRVYDQALGRFLQPDNNIQMPDNPQNYNRFTYALNNPLVYTDPSGDNPLLIAFALASYFGSIYSYEQAYQAYGAEGAAKVAGLGIAIKVLTAGFGDALGISQILDSQGNFVFEGLCDQFALNLVTNIASQALVYSMNGDLDKYSISDLGNAFVQAGINTGIDVAIAYANSFYSEESSNRQRSTGRIGKKELPSYKSVEKNYYGQNISPEEFAKKMGGKYWKKFEINENFENTCATRLSYALSNAGANHEIPPMGELTLSTANGHNLIYRVQVLEDYLTETYGEPLGPGKYNLSKDKGIIIFYRQFKNATGHSALWNGNKLLYVGYYRPHDYFNDPLVTKKLFWKLK